MYAIEYAQGQARSTLPLLFSDIYDAVDSARELLKKGFHDVRVIGPNFEMGTEALAVTGAKYRRDAWGIARVS
jgi:hypothetical protein